MALEALTKESRYPSQGVIEEFAKLNNLDGEPSRFGSIIKDNEIRGNKIQMKIGLLTLNTL